MAVVPPPSAALRPPAVQNLANLFAALKQSSGGGGGGFGGGEPPQPQLPAPPANNLSAVMQSIDHSRRPVAAETADEEEGVILESSAAAPAAGGARPSPEGPTGSSDSRTTAPVRYPHGRGSVPGDNGGAAPTFNNPFAVCMTLAETQLSPGSWQLTLSDCQRLLTKFGAVEWTRLLGITSHGGADCCLAGVPSVSVARSLQGELDNVLIPGVGRLRVVIFPVAQLSTIYDESSLAAFCTRQLQNHQPAIAPGSAGAGSPAVSHTAPPGAPPGALPQTMAPTAAAAVSATSEPQAQSPPPDAAAIAAALAAALSVTPSAAAGVPDARQQHLQQSTNAAAAVIMNTEAGRAAISAVQEDPSLMQTLQEQLRRTFASSLHPAISPAGPPGLPQGAAGTSQPPIMTGNVSSQPGGPVYQSAAMVHHNGSHLPAAGSVAATGPAMAAPVVATSVVRRRICRLELIDMFGYHPDGFNVINAICGPDQANIKYVISATNDQIDIDIKGIPQNDVSAADRLHIALVASDDLEVYKTAVDNLEDLLGAVCRNLLEYHRNLAIKGLPQQLPPPNPSFKRHDYVEYSDGKIIYATQGTLNATVPKTRFG